ncbi:hypothetical protein BLX24_28855 [Arsenicibacter rosenii]|uniref:Xylose isomerase-like TIM barrel domain-containing protein n=2 Tax=Arsenicibacter rosenii TaxID=1750698 RepID=A0A1S2VB75_9BACT|nr:hypothetical protein BLX24_28855 [Arsenicibacter rosenii]
MEIGVFAKTFSGPFEAVCGQVKTSGINRIQFNYACVGLPSLPQVIESSVLNSVQQKLDDYALTVEAVSGTFNMIHPDPAQREYGLTALETIAGSCHVLNTNLITLCTGSRNPDDMWKAHPENNLPDAWYDLRQTVDRALAIAERYNVFLGIEPETANVINTVGKAARLLKEVNSPYLKIVFDPANLFDREPDNVIRYRIQHGLALLGDSIMSAHAKDRSAGGKVVAAGKGLVPFPLYLEQLQGMGYTGGLIMHGLAPDEVAETQQYLRTVLSRITNTR